MCQANDVTDNTKAKGDGRFVFTHAWWVVTDNCGTSLNAHKLKKIRDKQQNIVKSIFKQFTFLSLWATFLVVLN